jgi:hypothetical protein
VITGRQALAVGANVTEYRSRIQHLGSVDMAGVPPELVGALRAMLAVAPASRPPAGSFTGGPWFQEDMLLRALRFLDTILQRCGAGGRGPAAHRPPACLPTAHRPAHTPTHPHTTTTTTTTTHPAGRTCRRSSS